MTGIVSSDADERLRASVSALADAAPEFSAQRVVTAPQAVSGLILIAAWVALALATPLVAAQMLVGVVTVGYVAAVVYRVLLFCRGVGDRHRTRVSDAEAKSVPDAELPPYTVLVPVHREPLIGELLAHLEQLDYPRDRLDVRVLLEADDTETIAAARATTCPPHVILVLVPPAEPRTKPKACNYGLVDARGELVTIYDAEDIPDPLQLRRAVVALRRLGPEYACVQAQLGYFNSTQNVLTRWFTVEYGTWFAYLLPGLIAVGAPVPLGGTSNHFRTDVLRSVGAWDAHNVTEDADLGIRLARLGYAVGVLESVTLEEANSDPINWVKQRSRWYKGYLQTFLVHARRPWATLRDLGWRGTAGLVLFVAGTPCLTALNGFFWALTLMWFTRHPAWLQALFDSWLYYAGLLCFVLGNLAVLYMNVYTTRQLGRPDLLVAALLSPLYWALMTLAATKAAIQLVASPSYWEKTTHGLHLSPTDKAEP